MKQGVRFNGRFTAYIVWVLFWVHGVYFIETQAGDVNGGGGDIVYCFDQRRFDKTLAVDPNQLRLHGIFTLDAIRAFMQQTYDLMALDEEPVQQIVQKLKDVSSPLALDLQFFEEMFQQGLKTSSKGLPRFSGDPRDLQPHKRYRWIHIPKQRIIAISDRSLDRSDFPVTCKNAYGELELHQVVYRHEAGNVVEFRLDTASIRELGVGSESYSWLVVHEWLRKFTNDALSILDINSYLHSSDFFENNTPEEALRFLRDRGVSTASYD